MIRRMVGKSSTIRIFMLFCTTGHSPKQTWQLGLVDGSDTMSVSAGAFQNKFTDVIQVDGPLGGTDQQGLARHAEHDAARLILCKGARTGLAHGQQALRTVLAHSRQDDPDRILA